MAEGVELEFTEKTKRIGIMIAIMATVLALSEAAGQNAQADAIRETVEASDLWAFFQAKTIRMTTLKSDAEMLELLAADMKPGPQTEKITKTVADWRATAERYDSEPSTNEGRKELSARATEKIAERDRDAAVNATFDLVTGALQIGILLASTAVVTDIVAFAVAGGVIGVIGIILAGFALWAPTVFGG
jgi:hypothetical protein